MSRLLVVVARGGLLEGTVADAAHSADGQRVFTLRGQEVARVDLDERCVVRALPDGRLPAVTSRPTVAAGG